MSSKASILRESSNPLNNINPIIFRGRNHIACIRCKNQKIKCSGDKPTCDNCKVANNECIYPFKDRKIIILESQLQNLQERVRTLESYIKNNESNNNNGNNGTNNNYNDSKNESLSPLIDDLDDKKSFIPFQFYTSNEKLDNVINLSFGDSEHQDKSFQPAAYNNNNINNINNVNSINYFVSDLYFDDNDEIILNFPNREYSELLVDMCLSNFRNSHYLYDEFEFLSDFNRIYQSGVSYSPSSISKILMTMAIGEQILYSMKSHELSQESLNYELSSKHKFLNKTPGMKYFLNAVKLFPINVELPSLSMIQTALLIGYYNQSLNRITTSYIWFGVATRWSLSLNLHLKQPHLTSQDIAKRKKVWWTVFALDSFATSRIRLPQTVKYNETQIDLLNEDDFKEWEGSKVLSIQVSLLKFTDKIINSVYYLNSRSLFSNEKNEDNNCLPRDLINNTFNMLKILEENFEQNLETEFQQLIKELYQNKLCAYHKSLVHVYLKFNQYVITTCRPLTLAIFKKFINPNEDNEKIPFILKKCIKSSIETIDLIYHLKSFKMLITFDYWHTHFLFNSILILLITFNVEDNIQYLYLGIDLLKFMASCGNHISKDSMNKLTQLVKIFNDFGIDIKVDLTMPDIDLGYLPDDYETYSEDGSNGYGDESNDNGNRRNGGRNSVQIHLLNINGNILDQNFGSQIEQTSYQLRQQQQQLLQQSEQQQHAMFTNPDLSGNMVNSSFNDLNPMTTANFFDNLLANLQNWDCTGFSAGLQDPNFVPVPVPSTTNTLPARDRTETPMAISTSNVSSVSQHARSSSAGNHSTTPISRENVHSNVFSGGIPTPGSMLSNNSSIIQQQQQVNQHQNPGTAPPTDDSGYQPVLRLQQDQLFFNGYQPGVDSTHNNGVTSIFQS